MSNNSRRHQLTNTLTLKLTNPSTPQLIYSKAHQLKKSRTQKLKSLSFILQNRPNFRSVLAKILVKKPLFPVFHALHFVCFQEKDLHLAPFCLSSLVANSYFFNSNYALLAPKTPLFNSYFAPFSHVFHGSKRFCLYHCSGYLCFSSCI